MPQMSVVNVISIQVDGGGDGGGSSSIDFEVDFADWQQRDRVLAAAALDSSRKLKETALV
jgi:hypothetical protein